MLDVGSTSQLSAGKLRFTLSLLKSSKSSSEKNQSTCWGNALKSQASIRQNGMYIESVSKENNSRYLVDSQLFYIDETYR